jgi:hypothetical protein
VTPRPAAAYVVAVALVLAAACGSGGTLDREALSQEADTLRSTAAEGALLARDDLAGRITSTFLREHAADLSDAMSQTAATLAAATTEPPLETQLQQLATLAAQVTAALEQLPTASTDEERILAEELQAAANTSQRIGEELA